MFPKKYLAFFILIIEALATKSEDVEEGFPDYYNLTLQKESLGILTDMVGLYEKSSLMVNNCPVFQKTNTVQGKTQYYLIRIRGGRWSINKQQRGGMSQMRSQNE